MLIRDLEYKTGLDRATIRFYEKEGFIAPERKENGYRSYSESDKDTLLKIKLLRQLGLPLDKIRQLQQGSGELNAALTEQIKRIDAQMDTLNRARLVCAEMRDAAVRYDSLDAEYYLKRLSEPVKSPLKREFREHVKREYHPWRRFPARMLDYQLMNSLLTFLLVVVLRVRPLGNIWSLLISYGTLFLMIPVNALLLHLFGTTPGKCVFGLHIESENGGNLSFSAAKDREWVVLHQGLGFGIPVWSYWRLYRSYQAYNDGEMDWDWETEYHCEQWNLRRKAVLAGMILLICALTGYSSADLIKPKYRGDLSISEFAANYNYYYSITNESADISGKLQPDGSWYPESEGTFTIYMDGQPVNPRQPFEYDTEDGVIRRVAYENTWTEIFYLNPLSGRLNAAMTAVLSQKGTGAGELKTFAALWEEELKNADGHLVYSNIEINWHIETENCETIGDSTYTCINEDQESSVSLEFEILIHK